MTQFDIEAAAIEAARAEQSEEALSELHSAARRSALRYPDDRKLRYAEKTLERALVTARHKRGTSKTLSLDEVISSLRGLRDGSASDSMLDDAIDELLDMQGDMRG